MFEPKHGDVVLMDANAIIEAFRAKCWMAVANTFRLETVETIVVEVGTGDSRRRDYTEVDVKQVRKMMTVHDVTPIERAELELKLPTRTGVDEGEFDLIAHAVGRAGAWLVCAPDKGALRAFHQLGCFGRCVALEKLVQMSGIRKPKLRQNYTRKWMLQTSMDFAFE
jgi:hypothetical protein